MSYTAHTDTFVRDNLPPRTAWPEFLFELPELRYPVRMNCATELLDKMSSAMEGKVSLDDPVLKYFREEAPAKPSANLKAMRVRDLLRMTTGHQTEPPRTPTQSWARSFLAHRSRLAPLRNVRRVSSTVKPAARRLPTNSSSPQ